MRLNSPKANRKYPRTLLLRAQQRQWMCPVTSVCVHLQNYKLLRKLLPFLGIVLGFGLC